VPEDIGGGYVLSQHSSQPPLSDEDFRIAMNAHEQQILWTGALFSLVEIGRGRRARQLLADGRPARRLLNNGVGLLIRHSTGFVTGSGNETG
jgi:hypothetical protein